MLDMFVSLRDSNASISVETFCNFFKCNPIIVLLQRLLCLMSSLTHENLLLVQFWVQRFESQIRVLGFRF